MSALLVKQVWRPVAVATSAVAHNRRAGLTYPRPIRSFFSSRVTPIASTPTQKALYLLKSKGKFGLKERGVQQPGPGEVLVEIHATALNPIDWKIQALGWVITDFPAILGLDSAGIVKKVGADVTNVAVGDKVLHQGSYDDRQATFQQYVVVPAEIVAKIPPNLTFEKASTLPVTVGTAALGLYASKENNGLGLDAPWKEGGRGKYAGEPILVIGGASGVGQHVIQFAKLSGFSPIITTASKQNEVFLKSIGATHVVDRSIPLSDLDAAVKAITVKPFKVAYDAVSSAETQNAVYDILAPSGKLEIVLGNAVDEGKITSNKEIKHISANVHLPQHRELGKSLYARLTGLLETGEIMPNNVEVVPGGLVSIPDGLEKLKKGVSAVKLVINPQEAT